MTKKGESEGEKAKVAALCACGCGRCLTAAQRANGTRYATRACIPRQSISLYTRTPRQEMLQGSHVSWWTAYAVGARRDQDYAAEAERRRLVCREMTAQVPERWPDL